MVSNKIRTALLIISNDERKELNNRTFPKINSKSGKDIDNLDSFIEIRLQDQFFKSDSNSRVHKIEGQLNTKRISKILPMPVILDQYEFLSENKYSSKDLKLGEKKKSNTADDVKHNANFSTNLKDKNLMEVYENFLECLDSKKSIGFEKLQKKEGVRPEYKHSATKSKFYEKIDLYSSHKIKVKNENKVESILDFLNREKPESEKPKKYKRVKKGIFYLHSLVYCLKKTSDDLQKGKKNKAEFDDFRKELLSPLINRRKTAIVSFELLKKVYMWKEDKIEKNEIKKQNENFKRSSFRNKTTINLTHVNFINQKNLNLKNEKMNENLKKNQEKEVTSSNKPIKNSVFESDLKSTKYDLFEVMEEDAKGENNTVTRKLIFSDSNSDNKSEYLSNTNSMCQIKKNNIVNSYKNNKDDQKYKVNIFAISKNLKNQEMNEKDFHSYKHSISSRENFDFKFNSDFSNITESRLVSEASPKSIITEISIEKTPNQNINSFSLNISGNIEFSKEISFYD